MRRVKVSQSIRRAEEHGYTGYEILLILYLRGCNYMAAAEAMIDARYQIQIKDGIQYPDQLYKALVITEGRSEKTVEWHFKASQPEVTQDLRTKSTENMPRWVKADHVTFTSNFGSNIPGVREIWYNDKCYSVTMECIKRSGEFTRYITVQIEGNWLNIEFSLNDIVYA